MKTMTGHPRHAFLVTMIALSVMLVGCGGSGKGSGAASPAADFAGWWFSDGGLTTLHIVKQGSAYRLAADSPLQTAYPLQREGDTLVVPLRGERLELTPASANRMTPSSLCPAR